MYVCLVFRTCYKWNRFIHLTWENFMHLIPEELYAYTYVTGFAKTKAVIKIYILRKPLICSCI